MLIDQRWPRSVTLRDLGVELTLGTGEFWPHFSICSTRTPPRLGPTLWGCPLPPGLVLGVASSGGRAERGERVLAAGKDFRAKPGPGWLEMSLVGASSPGL